MRKRLGLVGVSHNKEGKFNYLLASSLDVDRWLIRAYPQYEVIAEHPDVETVVCPTGAKIDKFCQSIDVVFFYGEPCFSNLVDEALIQHKRVVAMVDTGVHKVGEWSERVHLLLSKSLLDDGMAWEELSRVIKGA